jgi:hypothetical protein
MVFLHYRPTFFLKDIIETLDGILSESIEKCEWIQEKNKKCWRFTSWDGDIAELSLGDLSVDAEGNPAQYFILKGMDCLNFCDIIFIALKAKNKIGTIISVSEEDDHKSLEHTFYFANKGIPENCGDFGERLSS